MERSEEEQSLHQDGVMLNTSIEWWKTKVNICIGKLQILEEKFLEGTGSKEDHQKYSIVMDEVRTLLARGHVEDQELKDFEKRARKFANEHFHLDDDEDTEFEDLT